MNYSLKVPQEGGRIDILPRFEDDIRSTGRILAVFDEGLINDLENFTVRTETGAKLLVVVLRPESPMDAEAQRCFTLLDWHRSESQSLEDLEEPELNRRGVLKRVASGIWGQVKQRPMVVLGLIVITTGVILMLIGHPKLGQLFIDLGTKVILTIGAAMNFISASIPAILNDASDWIEPIYFLTRYTA